MYFPAAFGIQCHGKVLSRLGRRDDFPIHSHRQIATPLVCEVHMFRFVSIEFDESLLSPGAY